MLWGRPLCLISAVTWLHPAAVDWSWFVVPLLLWLTALNTHTHTHTSSTDPQHQAPWQTMMLNPASKTCHTKTLLAWDKVYIKILTFKCLVLLSKHIMQCNTVMIDCKQNKPVILCKGFVKPRYDILVQTCPGPSNIGLLALLIISWPAKMVKTSFRCQISPPSANPKNLKITPNTWSV